MESKKTNRANLEKRRALFFQIGLIITLALVLIAFEWKSMGAKNNDLLSYNGDNDFLEVLDMVDRTVRKDPLPPPPPMPPQEILIIPDYSLDEDNFDWNIDIDPDDGIVWEPLEEDDEEEPVDIIHVNPEVFPKFRGGDLLKFNQYVLSKIRYPHFAQEIGVEGTVHVQFVINEKGELVNATIVRSIHESLDNEVMAVLEDVPRWKPGKQYGIPVKVQFTMPVKFKLQKF